MENLKMEGRQMRSKKKIIITTFIGAIMLLAGCHSVGTDQEQKDNKKTDSETVKIEDIDWNVGEGIIDGDRHIVMNYVNNSKLDIVYFGLDYTEKEEITEEEKQQAQSIGLEPEVVFNTLSDRRILAVQTEDTHETIMEISGYDLQINFNRDKLQNIADIESMLDGLKDLFRRVVMQDLLESNVEKTNS